MYINEYHSNIFMSSITKLVPGDLLVSDLTMKTTFNYQTAPHISIHYVTKLKATELWGYSYSKYFEYIWFDSGEIPCLSCPYYIYVAWNNPVQGLKVAFWHNFHFLTHLWKVNLHHDRYLIISILPTTCLTLWFYTLFDQI